MDVFSLSPGRALIQTLLPISVGFMLLMLIDFSDVIIARGFLSQKDIAILGICYPMIYFMLAIGFGLNQGLTIVGSEVFIKKGRQALYVLFIQALMMSALLVFFLQMLTIVFIHYQWVSESFMPYLNDIKIYLYTIVSAIFPLFVLLLLSALCQIEGRVNVIRNTLLLMLVLTFVSHPLFALPVGFGWRLTGLAVSKIVVTLIGSLYAASQIIEWKDFRKTGYGFDVLSARKLARQAFPAIGIQILVPTYLIMLTRLVSQFGVEATAGFSIGYRIVMMVVIPILGVLIALLMLVTHDFFKRRYARVRKIITLSLSYGSMTIFCVLFLAYWLSYYVFTQSEFTLVEKLALQYLQLAMYITVLEFIIGVCTVSFQAVKKPLFACLIALTRTIIFPMPVFYFLSQGHFNIMDLWMGLAFSFTMSVLLSLILSYVFLWRKYS